MLEVLDPICTPKRGTEYSACIDLFAREDVVICAGETKLVPLGVKINKGSLFESLSAKSYFGSCRIGDEPEFEEHAGEVFNEFMNSHYLQLMPRSSLALKTGLVIANGVGIIDMDYGDEIGIVLHKAFNENEPWHDSSYVGQPQPRVKTVIKAGDRIAQITLLEHKSYLFGIESDAKRDGGFGSTDKN